MRRLTILAIVFALVVSACGTTSDEPELSLRLEPRPTAGGDVETSESSEGAPTSGAITDGGSSTETTIPDGPDTSRPDWLGSRTLPTNSEGIVPPQTTPAELDDRRFPTIDTLPPPVEDTFTSTIEPLGGDPLARSTWVEGCPVPFENLAYLTMTFWGFDGRSHTGEMIVHADVAQDVVGVFEKLYDARYPIEEMRIITQADLDNPPTGDGNNTASFSCRPVVGGTRFSEHASGLAIDINPFINPYVSGERVLPELATSYLDRGLDVPGIIVEGSLPVQAFDAIGWGWGGRWNSLKDHQHFALNNR